LVRYVKGYKKEAMFGSIWTIYPTFGR